MTAPPSIREIGPRYWAAVLGILIAAAGALWLAGRTPICVCGYVALWHGALDAGNSQHIADWYSPSHVIHGFLFYLAGRVLLRRWGAGSRLVLAVAVEAAWEVLENSPIIINRYRDATIALGYTGDSIVNSLADISFMALGFAFARRAPVWVTIVVAFGFELMALWAIRDNLTLNIIMLIAPNDAIRHWQAGG